MRVVIRYFAALRDIKHRVEETVELPEGTTALGAYAAMGLPTALPVAFAVNMERVPGGTALAHGDELVFLPPVGGG
ncbi:MAG: MoaD/ThiS family protein [Deltaproteobacteria bacterium]|nr:MoaD/ThiS family protein [Deltaproteobacteria bacterium]